MKRRRTLGRAGVVSVALVLVAAATFIAVPLVLAGTAISIGPSIPTGGGSVTVGDTLVPSSLNITNNSTAPENTGTINVSSATLTVVSGVFSLSGTGTGDASTPGCAGSTWTITGGPATFTFTPTSAVNLTSTHASPPTTTFDCQINFTVNVLTRPATEPTNYSAGVSGVWSVDGTTPATGTGASSTTINKVSPTLPTTPSAGGPIGTVLNDSATVTGGSSPTGTVDFKLFPPSDATCAGTPVYTQSGVALVAGTASTSPGYTSLVAGTYRWTAHYSGDGNNNSADSGCTAEPVVITQPFTANLTPGYWKTHEAATTALLPQTLGGYSVTTYADAKIILSGMGCGSAGALNCMAGMLLAAKLNLQQGGSTCILPVVAQADALLIANSYSGFKPYTLSASDKALAMTLHDELSAYNIDGVPTC